MWHQMNSSGTRDVEAAFAVLQQKWTSVDAWLGCLCLRYRPIRVYFVAALIIDATALFLYSPPVSSGGYGFGSRAVIVQVARDQNRWRALLPANCCRAATYVQQARHPFAATDPQLAFRITTPFVAWLLGLRGHSALILPYIAALLFFFFLIKFVHERTNDLVIALALAFGFASVPVGHASNIYPGFVDSVTNVLALLALFIVNPGLLSLCVFAGLWNDERMMLMLPGIFLARWFGLLDERQILRKSHILAAIGTPFLFYAGMRAYLELFTDRTSSGAFEYWRSFLHTTIPLGTFFALKTLWTLPLVALGIAVVARQKPLAGTLLLMLAVPAVQLVTNADVNRSLAIAFPAVIIAVIWLARDVLNRGDARRIILSAVLLALVIPQYNVVAAATGWVKPLPVTVILRILGFDDWRELDWRAYLQEHSTIGER
jgi:hypothetical protein